MPEKFSLVTVASGARSLRSLEHGETFHPVVGPMAEARGLHAAQSRLRERVEERTRQGGGAFIVWDVGLGAAANAVAALEELSEANARVELHSFDCTLAPLAFARAHAEELGYLAPWATAVDALLATRVAQVGSVAWHLHLGDFRALDTTAPEPDAILYDPYSPTSNPGLWTIEHFTRLRARCGEACTLTSYSRSTAVRVTLGLAGFFVGRGTATGEKNETTVAATRRDLLSDPLGEAWLGRVQRSTRGGPLRDGQDTGMISPEELAALRRLIL